MRTGNVRSRRCRARGHDSAIHSRNCETGGLYSSGSVLRPRRQIQRPAAAGAGPAGLFVAGGAAGAVDSTAGEQRQTMAPTINAGISPSAASTS